MANIREETLVALREMAKNLVGEKIAIQEETIKLADTVRFMEDKIELENIQEIISKLHISMGNLEECIGSASAHINEVAEAYEDVIRFMAKL